jgi:tRNA A37 threonylcarbamoyladenosine modification protein TsaB
LTSEPLILGFDTSAAHCAAALLRGDRILDARAIEMSRGQAEELMPLLEDILAKHDVTWTDLTALGVGVGPGNFTGIRISVAAARGLALALDIPAVGVSTFEASTFGRPDASVAIVPAPRDQIYVSDPSTGEAPFLTQAPYGATNHPVSPPPAAPLAENIARVALEKAAGSVARPAPLYIRAADATPSRDLPPTIL